MTSYVLLILLLFGLLVFMGWWMIANPDRPLPGYKWGGLPDAERSRFWGRTLLACAVPVLALLIWTIAAT